MKYCNPLAPWDTPDPFVVYDDNTGYYYCLFSLHNKLTIYRSKHICDLLNAEDTKTVMEVGEVTGIYGCVWAPELHKINGNWYLYSSGATNPDGKHDLRLFVMKSNTQDPFDGFSKPKILEPRFAAIDATVYRHEDGALYICYSKMFEEKTGGPGLQLRKMKSPTELTEEMELISSAEYDWEQEEPYVGKHSVNEGPFFLIHDNRLFLVYSANGCWLDNYCLGVLEYQGGDFLAKASWKKQPEPLLRKGNGVFGPGHASFFKSPDGSEIWIAYHGMEASHGEKKEARIRRAYVQKVEFDENGYPIIGAPIPRNIDIKSPSGEK